MKRRKGFYSISVLSKMFAVHQQTIRMYEKEGLICPKRTEGNTRLFSEEDVDRLEHVINLTHKMGVNIAGVQMILKLQGKMKKMQEEMTKLFETAQVQLDVEKNQIKSEMDKDGKILLDMKKECGCDDDKATDSDEHDSKEFNDWEIEYEDKD
ncbi:MerR family transcriptional regulator [Candidatus Dependentiae bacterium]|nr:MerR family transcriptional regulator [Candidatus Dependentiae bacterium]